MKMKVILTCGGTGGHITPALAIADLIKRNWQGAEILFVGTGRELERTMICGAGYGLKPLHIEGLPRRPGIAFFRALYLLERAVKEARELLKLYEPHIVIGTGSYACYPTLRAAAALGIPTAVHESNAVPGLAVRLLSHHLDRIWLNFEVAGTKLRQKEKLLTVGNPLRRSEGGAGRPLPQGCRRMVLSFGGSLGADAINEAVLQLMQKERAHREIYHLHATGKREYESFMSRFTALGLQSEPHLEVRPFIADMPLQMASATVTISRAGAMSISELAANGCAAILIPSPNVTGNHQYVNAAALAERGAAVLLPEESLVDGALTDTVLSLLSDAARREKLQQAIRAFATPEAERFICEDIRYLLKSRGG